MKSPRNAHVTYAQPIRVNMTFISQSDTKHLKNVIAMRGLFPREP